MGGKTRISKQVVEFLEGIRLKNQTYLEPFCGSFAVGSKMSGRRVASDAFQAIVSYHQGLQRGWIPPQVISIEDWKSVKAKMDLFDPLTAHCGFNCSFGGVWFAGYSHSVPANDYIKYAYDTSLKLASRIKEVEFSCCSYLDHQPENCLIYCDPPYAGTTDYSKQLKSEFDSELFWQTMREWSKRNTVVVSEYKAPDDFVCVKRMIKYVGISCEVSARKHAIEKLFMHKSNVKLPFLTRSL